jgi:hypothetical protein
MIKTKIIYFLPVSKKIKTAFSSWLSFKYLKSYHDLFWLLYRYYHYMCVKERRERGQKWGWREKETTIHHILIFLVFFLI